MPTKDYYKTLGVEKTASQDEIKSAYRRLAKQYHPDLHPNDKEAAEKFKEINEAYSVVGDPDKRGKYDRGEMDPASGGAGFNPFGGAGGFTATGFDDIFDMFSDAFGFGGRSRRNAAANVGSDITCRIDLTFMESILGCTKNITYTRLEKCPTCNGSGAKDSAHVKICDKCSGTGQVRYVQQTLLGQHVTVGVCDKCGGTGRIITDYCRACGGKGLVSKTRTVTVTIPAGVEHGEVRQLSGEGNAARGNGRNGNVLLEFSVRPSTVFRREGYNLYVDVPVSFMTAACGGQIEIPAPEGVFIHNLAEGTPNGETLRFRGRGVRSQRGAAGDLYATVNVEVPRGISRTQKKALEQFENDCTIKNYSKRKQFMDEIAKLYKN